MEHKFVNFDIKDENHLINHENYKKEDIDKIEESGSNYNNNFPTRTEKEVFNIKSLEGKIKNTKEAIEAIRNNISDLGIEMSKEAEGLIESLNNKIIDYTIKLEEIKDKEKVSE